MFTASGAPSYPLHHPQRHHHRHPACSLPQGIKWIKSREASSGLVILQQSQPKYVDKVLQCIEQVGRHPGCPVP